MHHVTNLVHTFINEQPMQGNGNFVVHLLCCRNYMNDSLRTNVFVRFQAETIACACIYLAARVLQVTIAWPSPPLFTLSSGLMPWIFSNHSFSQISLPSRPHWYLLFGATEEEIKDICVTTLKLYTRKKVRLVRPHSRFRVSWSPLVLYRVCVSYFFPFWCVAKLWIAGEGSGQAEGGSTGSQTEGQRTESRWHSCSLHFGWILSWIQTMYVVTSTAYCPV